MRDQSSPVFRILGQPAGSRESEEEAFCELDATREFIESCPPLRCCGEDWYSYSAGAWTKQSRDLFRPKALAIIPDFLRTIRRAKSILDHAEAALQVDDEDLRGFHMFDGAGVLLNCANGVLKVSAKGVDLLPHAKEYNFTSKAAATFDMSAECPRFNKLLMQAVPDPEDRDLLETFCGSILLPSSRLETSLCAYGPGGTGKSTVFEAIANALGGGGLVSRLNMIQICDPRGYHTPALRHAALNLGTELDSLEVEDGAAFKALVSGESIMVRPIYGKPFAMKSSAKLAFLTNELPRFKHGSDGELRRMRFIRFTQKPEKPDTGLKRQLEDERDGIFCWLINGLMRVLPMQVLSSGGEASRNTLAQFAAANDPIGTFVRTRCVLGGHLETDKGLLEEAYSEFIEDNGMNPTMKGWFFRRLYERFPEILEVKRRDISQLSGRKRLLAGIALKEEDEADV